MAASAHDFNSRDVFEWSAQDVSAWVSSIGLSDRASCFIENCITGMALAELDNDDLRSLGLTKVGERKVFLRALRKLQERESGPPGPASKGSSSSHNESSEGDSDSWDTHSMDSEGSRRSAGSKRSTKKFSNHLCKAYYRDRTKVFEMAKDSSFRELRSQIRSLFHKRMTVQWKDSDGDKLTLKRDRDWSRCKRENGERIRLWVTPASSEADESKRSEFRAMSSLADPVIAIDATGKILMFNGAAETFFGYKAGMMVGSKVNLLMPDDEAARHDGYLQHYIETGEKRVMGKGRRVVAQTRSGEKVPVYLTLSETTSRKRTDRQFIGTLQDMRTQSEDMIIKTDQSAAYAVLQNILDAAVVIDHTGIVKFFNSAAEDLFGYKPSQVVGKNVSMLMQGKDKREHNNYLATYLRTGKSSVIGKGRNVVAALSDGSLRSVHLAVSEQKLSASLSLFTGIIRPIDDEPEEDTGKQQVSILEQMRDVLENLLVAAVVIDDQGKILAFNESAEELFGYKLVNVVGKNVKMLCPPEHAANHDQYLSKWRETGEEHVFGIGRDLTAKTASGAIIPIRLSVTKRKDETGRFLLTGTFQQLR